VVECLPSFRVLCWIISQGWNLKRRWLVLIVVTCLLIGVDGKPVGADGHGPIFGFSTTTLGLGDASVGTEYMWRSGASMLGPEFAYGLKENLQISISAPFHVDHGEHPAGRFMALMAGDPSVEVLLGWRFLHSSTGIATRNEATFYAGASALTQQVPRGDGPPLARQPGLYGALAVGHVARSYDLWIGGGYQHYARWTSNVDDHQSDTLLTSFVAGWRPSFLNGDYPSSDFRIFLETTAEKVGLAQRDISATSGGGDLHGGPPPPPNANGIVTLPNSGGTGVFSGPTFLLTHRSVAVQGGVLFALLDQPNGTQKHEHYRVGAGITYYFLGRHK